MKVRFEFIIYFIIHILTSMKGSPINTLNYNKDDISPYKPLPRRSDKKDLYENSPERHNSNLNEVEYWKLKSRKNENQILAMNEELNFQRRKLIKIEELEEKIQVLLRQNTHLVEQNQGLLKVIQQAKNEADVWKFKYESQFSNANVLENEARRAYDNFNRTDEEHKLEVDRLLAEISRLHDQIEQIQKLKQIQLDGVRNKYEAEAMNHIQNLKRSQQGNTELYELNIRKLRDALEERGFENESIRKDNKLEAERLNGEISFLKNEIKKVEQQKQYEIQLIKAENQNNVNNLSRTHKKNEEEMKGLYENKIRRMGYEIEEKKNEIEECLSKIKKTGKEGELEIVRLIEEKDKLRLQIRDNDVRYNRELADTVRFFEAQLQTEKDNSDKKEDNLKTLLQGEIDKLRRVIENKQKQIEALIQQNRVLKQNEQIKLSNIRDENRSLKDKIQEIITHYEREMELLKIKVSNLYEADLEALRSLLTHQLEIINSENAKLKQALTETNDKLLAQIEEKLLMRRDYENRLNEMNIKFEREHQQLEDLLVMAEKNYDNVRSQTSVRDIEHASKLKRTNTSIQGIVGQKRTLQNQIKNKNKEIEELNLRIQKMEGNHKREINDLQNRLRNEQENHKKFMDLQNKENKENSDERELLKTQYKDLSKKYRDEKDALQRKLNEKNQELQIKRLKIAELEGKLQQLARQHGSLDSKLKVQVGNIEKTNLELQSMMNNEKEKLEKVREADKQGIRRDYQNRVVNLKREIADNANQIEVLRKLYEDEKLKTKKLQTDLRNVLNSVEERSKLQDHVINIGLSNNYFKNVAEIFKKRID